MYIKSVFFKKFFLKRTGTTCKEQSSMASIPPLTYRSSLLIVQWCNLLSLTDGLREEIRTCVREELQKIERTPDQISNQSLVERTRSLIQSPATPASQALARNETLNQCSPLASVTSTPRFSSNKRPAPGHPLRFSGKKQSRSL